MTITITAKPCVFPFKYKGVAYRNCTTEGNGVIPWCATSVTSNGHYKGWVTCDRKCRGNSDILYQ